VIVQRVGTESVTFLSNQENNGTLYSIPGITMPYNCVYSGSRYVLTLSAVSSSCCIQLIYCYDISSLRIARHGNCIMCCSLNSVTVCMR